MYFEFLTLIFLTFFGIIVSGQQNQTMPDYISELLHREKPLIIFKSRESLWEKVVFSRTNQRAYYSNSVNASFEVACAAPFPIQWNCSSLHPSHNLNSSIFETSPQKEREIFGIVLKVLKSSTISILRVACEKIGEPEVMDEVFIFDSTAIGKLFMIGDNEIGNSHIIPCLTTDNTTEVLLYVLGENEAEVLVSDFNNTLQYNPMLGFQSERIFDEGNYICRQNHAFDYIYVFNSTNQNGESYSPFTQEIQIFDDENITLKCSTKSAIAYIKLEDQNNEHGVTFLSLDRSDYRDEPFKYKGANSSFPFKKLPEDNAKNIATYQIHTSFSNGMVKVNGTAVCKAKEGNLTRKVAEWKFEILNSPELHLENYEKQIQCIGPGLQTKIEILPCKHSYECNFMNIHCPKGNLIDCKVSTSESHSISDSGGFSQQTNKNCKWLPRQQSSKIWGCVSVPYTHLNGLVRCSVDGLQKEWEFFESLNHRKYTNWRDVPRELVRIIDDMPKILYQNRRYSLVCECLPYLFSDWGFEIEFQNGSKQVLRDNEVTVIISSAESHFIKDLIGALSLEFVLPSEASGIHCAAYLWNSTEVVRASKYFETIKPNADNEGEPKPIEFYNGQKDRKLVCHVDGEDHLNYTWYFNDNRALDMFPELNISKGSKGESLLEFPEISSSDGEKYAGEYKCVAENRQRKFETKYLISVTEKQVVAELSAVYTIVGVTGSIIFVVVLVVMLVYVRKYQIAKKLLRDLTDAEVDEFFDGRPELAGNGGNAETADYLPYNREYEIPFDDLDFTYSDNNLLGSGEFAFVLRGLILSKGKPVALKISKPSTDVVRFKSLLSEVKIMSYIGQHEHVMSLIGVCTEGIRTRSIHIATEICGMGSLHSFLQKSRPVFISLINENQQIDMNLIPKNMDEGNLQALTTIDLISFSVQIAKGMEYLAFKSVVHADLATRNVLLTSDKVAKISDFGLSKQLYESTNYVKKSKAPLPWRWMALEALQSLTFSTKSDVWSYGVTLYELFTLGDIPFPNEGWSNEFVARLEGGMRMGRPKHSTQKIYSKIMMCWESDPEQRPSFTMLRTFFEKILNKYSSSNPKEGKGLDTRNSFPENFQERDQTCNSRDSIRYVNNDGFHRPKESQSDNSQASYANL